MNTPKISVENSSARKAGWTVSEWCADAGLGRSSLYLAMRAGTVRFVKFGSRTIITTSPGEFLASLAEKAA